MAPCGEKIRAQLAALADGSLENSERSHVVQHLSVCPDCDAELRHMQETVDVLHRGFSRDRLVADMTSRVMMYLPDMDPELPACGHESAPGHSETSSYLKFLVGGVAAALLLVAGLTWLSWPTRAPVIPASNQAEELLSGTILGLTNGGIRVINPDGSMERYVTDTRYPLERNSRYETDETSGAVLGLEDGTQVRLFENSSLTITSSRSVRLERGSAYFEVTHNGDRFRVKTPEGWITVMGTAFGVSVENGRTAVTVINGMVQVENDTNFVLLAKDEHTEMGSAVASLAVKKNETAVAMWLSKIRSLEVDRKVEEEWIRAAGSRTGRAHPVRAERVFVVDVGSRKVTGLRLEWRPDSVKPEPMGYSIYIRDGSLKPLAKGYVPGRIFTDSPSATFDLVLPINARKNGSSLLHISVVPDADSGVNITELSEVYALTEP